MKNLINDGVIDSDVTEDFGALIASISPTQPTPVSSVWGLRLWARIFRRFLLTCLIFPITRLSYKIDILCADNLLKIQGPALLIANHVLHMDNAIYLKAMPKIIKKRLAIAASAHMFNNYLRGLMITLIANAFPFATGKRGKRNKNWNVRTSLDNMGSILDKGWSVLIYPEGELTVGGPMKPFLNGTGLMATASNLPVIPMRLDIIKYGRPSILPLWARGHVVVSFGEPLMPPWGSNIEEATSIIEDSVAILEIKV